MKIGQVVVEKIVEKKLARYDEIKGCTEEEIEAVMNAQGVTLLPQIYKEYLLAVGKNAGKLWANAGHNINSLRTLKNSANRLLKEDGNPITLPDDAFVFFMSEGMLFYYFLTSDQSENPSVFEYCEVEYSHGKLDYNLYEFLTNVY